GIRDLIVTGVQTCALPIYLRAERVVSNGIVADPTHKYAFLLGPGRRSVVLATSADQFFNSIRQIVNFGFPDLGKWFAHPAPGSRSEERRVGKECSSRCGA